MGSGVIYAVIVGLWALVLIPLWLRNHDRNGEVRNVDRYRAAMTSVYGPDGRLGRPSSLPRVEPAEADEDERSWSTAPSAADVAAARRRMVTGVLVGLLVGAVLLVVLGVLPAWFLLMPAAILGGFVLAGQQQSRAAEAQRRREAMRYRRDPRPAPQSARRAPTRSVQRSAGDLPEVRRQRDLEAEDGWSPVSAPLPTYVSAPRASRVPRVIDLTDAGPWDGEAMVDQARRQREDERARDRRSEARAILDELDAALPGDDDSFFDQLASEARGDGFFDQEQLRAANE